MPNSPARLATLRGTAVLALVLVPSALAAQLVPTPPARAGDDDAWAAYNALSLTPDGALAPIAEFMLSRPGEPLGPLRVTARAAGGDRNAFTEQRAFAATVDFAVPGASLAVTAGYVDFSCPELQQSDGSAEDCRGGWHAGARLGRSLWSLSLDAAGSNVLVVGAEGTAGYADAMLLSVPTQSGSEADASFEAFTASVAIPVGVRTRIGRVTVAPMIAPRLAYGRSTLEIEGISRDTGGAPRFVLGGGVAVRLGSHLGIDAGVQRVHVDRAGTMYGLAASVGF